MAILRVEKHNSSSTECVDKSSLQRWYRLESQWTFWCDIRSIIYPLDPCPISKHIGDHRGHDNFSTIFHLPRCLTMRCHSMVLWGHHRVQWDAPSTCTLSIKFTVSFCSTASIRCTVTRLCCLNVCCSVSSSTMISIQYIGWSTIFISSVSSSVLSSWSNGRHWCLCPMTLHKSSGRQCHWYGWDLDVDWGLVWNTECCLDRRAWRNIYVQLTWG